jgi:GntR family transcriptional regulator / MocR family aminotransferase
MAAPSWAELYAWQVDRGSGTPLFRQVYLEIRGAILARRLAPGTKLPSTRRLAARLGMARASVVSAYEQLLAEGYLAGKVGSGTYIAPDLPEAVERRDLARARPPLARPPRLPARVKALEALVPSTAEADPRPFNPGRCSVDARTLEAWRAISGQAVRSLGPAHLGYSDARGLIELRTAIAEYLAAARAVRCAPEQIVVTAGTQQAVDIAIRVLLDPGDEVWVEDPGYAMTHAALTAAGVRCQPIPVDQDGLDVAAGIAAAPRARAALVTPSHQFPLGVTLSMPRRLELLAWAREAGAWIVEDDYDSEFRYGGRPLASLQGLDDGERTIYVGTLNKLLFPGVRVGYAVVPPALLRAFVNMRHLTDRHPPSLGQMVVAEFMRQGHFAGHIRRVRLVCRDQRDTLVSELRRLAPDRLSVDAVDQGKHLVAYLARGLSDVGVEAAALRRGVVTRAISRMYRKATPRSGLLLGFTGYSRAAIASAAGTLARVVGEQPARAMIGHGRRSRR